VATDGGERRLFAGEIKGLKGHEGLKGLMKGNVSFLLAMLGAAGLFGAAGCKPSGSQDEESNVPTEVSVQVAKVTRATLHARVAAYGTVEPAPAGDGRPAAAARLAAPLASIVTSVPVKEGEHVAAGTLIVKLDDRVAQAAEEKAKSELAFAEQVAARQNKLKAVDGTSEKAIEESASQVAAARADLASAQAQLALVRLASPIDGTVARVNVQAGQAVDLNTVVAEIVDPTRLVVTTGIPVSDAGSLKVGQTAELFDADSDKPMATGTLSFISPSVDEKSGTMLARVAVPKDTALRPGQFVRVRIVTDEHAGCLAVPIESVVSDIDGHKVIALVQGDKATQRPVNEGIRDGGLVEVAADGLKEGDTVVTLGAYGLPKETKVKIVSQ
jgi:RND family efflux transporter MFP subunit